LDGLGSTSSAERLVDDYARRNFVTAGGWALEELAIESSPSLQKSTAERIDAQRQDPTTSDYHLYVLKSGLVTRNSDIVNALKRHGRSAERLLRQGRATTNVHLNYVILQGKTESSFADGVARPASAEFWAEILGVAEDEAIEFALAMAAEAGRRVTSDASAHRNAMALPRTQVTVIRSGPGRFGA
jgi:sugar phosphate isomerase/epimerase